MLKLDGRTDLAPDSLNPQVSLEELSSIQCKWPYDNLMCCGRIREIGKPYCAEHYGRITTGKTKPLAQGGFLQVWGNNPGSRKKKPLRSLTSLSILEIG